jgi:hypothetical protein
VDVIVTGVNASTVAFMKATTTIPIIMTNGVDPIGAGLVASAPRRERHRARGAFCSIRTLRTIGTG